MAIVSILTTTRAAIAQLDLDCSISESHKASAQVSRYPVESGYPAGDNVSHDPDRLTIEGLVSMTPLFFGAIATSAINAAVSSANLGGLVGAAAAVGGASIGGLVSSALSSGPRKPGDVYKYLKQLKDKGAPISIVTGLEVYQDMILTDLDVPRNAANVGGLRFTATFERVTILASAASIASASATTLDGAKTKSDIGKQGAGAAKAKTSSDASLLFQAIYGG